MQEPDRIIQSKLNDFEEEVSPLLWSEIERKLPAAPYRSWWSGRYMKYVAVVLLFLISSITWLFFISDSHVHIVRNEIHDIKQKKVIEPAGNSTPLISENKYDASKSLLNNGLANSVESAAIPVLVSVSDENTSSLLSDKNDETATVENQSEQTSVINTKPTSASSFMELSKEQSHNYSLKSKVNNDFTIGLIAANAISATQYSPDTRRTRSDIYYTEFSNEILRYKHKMPLSIGFTFEKQFARYWGLETGVIYSFLRSDYTSENLIREGKQELHYLGVPLLVRYRFFNTRHFNFYVSAGPRIDFNIYGRRTDRSVSDDAKSTYTENVRDKRAQWSAHLNLGISYAISSLFDIYAEPSVSYFFDNGNENIANMWKDKPFNFSFHLGFRTKF